VIVVMPQTDVFSFDSQEEARELLEPQNLRGAVESMDRLMEQNKLHQEIVETVDSGKPGHYWGRDIMLEGAMPFAHFMVAALEYGGDPNWFKDDKNFQDFLKRNPGYSWLHRR